MMKYHLSRTELHRISNDTEGVTKENKFFVCCSTLFSDIHNYHTPTHINVQESMGKRRR